MPTTQEELVPQATIEPGPIPPWPPPLSARARGSGGARRSGRARAAARVAGPEPIVQAGSPAAVHERSEHQAHHQKSTPKHGSHVSRSHDLGFAFKNQRRKRSGCYCWTGSTAWNAPLVSLWVSALRIGSTRIGP